MVAHFVEICCRPSVQAKVYETKQKSLLLVHIHLVLSEKYQK